MISNYCKVSGSIEVYGEKICYLEQKLSNEWADQTISDYFLKERPNSERDYSVYDHYDIIQKRLKNFGFSENVLDDDSIIRTLSGGEQVKLQMAKILSQNPSVLLLDEPTNDLDINTLNWMEDFIKNCSMPIMFISHDEILLENCANRILHIEHL